MDPGPLGTLGVGSGYAMAAQLARPDARVVIALRCTTGRSRQRLDLRRLVRSGIDVRVGL